MSEQNDFPNTDTKRKRLVLIFTAALILLVTAFAWNLYSDHQEAVAKQAAATAKLEEQQKEAESARISATAAVTDARRQKAEQEIAEQKEIKARCDTAEGADILMAYKSGRGQTIRAVDTDVDRIPNSASELKAMPQGDCRHAIFFFEEQAPYMADVFFQKTDGMLKQFVDAGFGRIMFVDHRSVCQALILPGSLGVGQVICHDR